MSGTFGVGTPFTHPAQTGPWGISPFGAQGLSINPFALQQLYGQPFASLGSGPTLNPYGGQPLQQVVQLLQVVPQQLQQLEYLQLQQLQQLQQVHQLVQLIPTQLAQLHQLIQLGSRQIQPSAQLQQPFGQIPGPGTPWGIQPQGFGAQPGHVM